jgi:TPP-dependent indolepyruvate ferredoxin oxidoreductase alpha subunit
MDLIVCRTHWTGDQPCHKAAAYTGQHKTQKNPVQTSIPGVGFEPTMPVIERTKTFHASDRAATVIGRLEIKNDTFIIINKCCCILYQYKHKIVESV